MNKNKPTLSIIFAICILVLSSIIPSKAFCEESMDEKLTLATTVNFSVAAKNWSKLKNQEERNKAVVKQAKKDIGIIFGTLLNCKTWIQQRVIPFVTGWKVEIPKTTPDENGFEWEKSPDVKKVTTGGIKDAKPGQIVQMRYYNNGGTDDSFIPHTAIIMSNHRNSICVIDNVRYHKKPYSVGKRCYMHTAFNQRTRGEYSIYIVLSGNENT